MLSVEQEKKLKLNDPFSLCENHNLLLLFTEVFMIMHQPSYNMSEWFVFGSCSTLKSSTGMLCTEKTVPMKTVDIEVCRLSRLTVTLFLGKYCILMFLVVWEPKRNFTETAVRKPFQIKSNIA